MWSKLLTIYISLITATCMTCINAREVQSSDADCDPNPCGIRATCHVISINNGKNIRKYEQCFCPGNAGPYKAEHKENCDPCKTNPCDEDAICISSDGIAHCQCPDGTSTGIFKECVRTYPCIPYPCGINTECSGKPGGFPLCTCIIGYTGNPDQECFVAGCPSPWFKLGGQCFLAVGENESERRTWASAREYCATLTPGADLAQPNNIEAISIYIGNKFGGNDHWLGGSDIKEEAHWIWNNGSPITGGWYPGTDEPNDAGGEDCLDLWPGNGANSLGDHPCSRIHSFICERVP